MKRQSSITLIIIIAVILLSIIILMNSGDDVPEKTALCIAQNAVLYVQKGCHACETQEKMFGDSYQYLNSVDCLINPDDVCNTITATPTWIIDGQRHLGVQSIEKLKELTGC